MSHGQNLGEAGHGFEDEPEEPGCLTGGKIDGGRAQLPRVQQAQPHQQAVGAVQQAQDAQGGQEAGQAHADIGLDVDA